MHCREGHCPEGSRRVPLGCGGGGRGGRRGSGEVAADNYLVLALEDGILALHKRGFPEGGTVALHRQGFPGVGMVAVHKLVHTLVHTLVCGKLEVHIYVWVPHHGVGEVCMGQQRGGEQEPESPQTAQRYQGSKLDGEQA